MSTAKLLQVHLLTTNDELWLNPRYIVSVRRVHYAHDDATEIQMGEQVPMVYTVREDVHLVLQGIADVVAAVVLEFPQVREQPLDI
jgi:hypothetical protein